MSVYNQYPWSAWTCTVEFETQHPSYAAWSYIWNCPHIFEWLGLLFNGRAAETLTKYPTSSSLETNYRWDEGIHTVNAKNYNCRSLLKEVVGIIDGARMPCVSYTALNVQKAYYEKFTCSVEATILLVYKFKVEIIHAGIKFSSRWHDNKLSHASGPISIKMNDGLDSFGFAILDDSTSLQL